MADKSQPKLIGIQIGAVSFIDEGVEPVLDILQQQGNIMRALKVRYPNIKVVFLASRIYAGYASTMLNPEPYAYESGFGVKCSSNGWIGT